MIVRLNFCVQPTKIHFCKTYKRHWYVLLSTKDIYMHTSNQLVRKVNETKKCGCCKAIVVIFLSMLAFVNDFVNFRLNPPQNVLGINCL